MLTSTPVRIHANHTDAHLFPMRPELPLRLALRDLRVQPKFYPTDPSLSRSNQARSPVVLVLLEHFLQTSKLAGCPPLEGRHLQVDAVVVAVLAVIVHAVVVLFQFRLTPVDDLARPFPIHVELGRVPIHAMLPACMYQLPRLPGGQYASVVHAS